MKLCIFTKSTKFDIIDKSSSQANFLVGMKQIGKWTKVKRSVNVNLLIAL